MPDRISPTPLLTRAESGGERWAYIGRLRKADDHYPAGTVVCAAVDMQDARTEKAVAKWMREGLTIERVPVGWVRTWLLTQQPYPSPFDADA